MADTCHSTDIPLDCLDSAYSSRKNSHEQRQTSDCSAKERISGETTLGTENGTNSDNFGATIKKGQKYKALLATSLQAFWVIG
jgi:hypothetical protein